MQNLNKEVWTMEIPVISTGHFPQADAAWLYICALFIEQTDGEPRTCILAKIDFENKPIQKSLDQSSRKILQFIFTQADYVRLDPDGDHLEGFETFQW